MLFRPYQAATCRGLRGFFIQRKKDTPHGGGLSVAVRGMGWDVSTRPRNPNNAADGSLFRDRHLPKVARAEKIFFLYGAGATCLHGPEPLRELPTGL
jgi:hypothetical protein